MYRFAYCSLLAVVVFGFLAGASSNSAIAAESEVTFRDLVFKSFETNEFAELSQAVGQTGPLKQVIALEYKVLLWKDGEETVVDPKVRPFKLGDKIRITVRPLKDSYIYIFHIGASGKSSFLVPQAEKDPPLIKANEDVVLPSDGYFKFVAPPGDEKLKVVAAEDPVPDLPLLARVLTKDPKDYTEEEKQVRRRLSATVEANLRSVEEEEQAKRKKLVTFRGIGADVKKAAQETRAAGADKTVVEVPGDGKSEGTVVVFVSTEQGDGDSSGKSSLLVTIPLKSQRAPEK
jgi:uncharacterized protein DUF4384